MRELIFRLKNKWWILGLLILFIVGLIGYRWNLYKDHQIRTAETQGILQHYQKAIDHYRQKCGYYPQKLFQLNGPDNCRTEGKIQGPLVEIPPHDAWYNDLGYFSYEDQYEIRATKGFSVKSSKWHDPKERIIRAKSLWLEKLRQHGSNYQYTLENLHSEYRFSRLVEVKNSQALNLNENSRPAYTIERLYDRCFKDFETFAYGGEAYFFLSFSKDGLIEHCGYFPLNCADDCFEGFNITRLNFH